MARRTGAHREELELQIAAADEQLGQAQREAHVQRRRVTVSDKVVINARALVDVPEEHRYSMTEIASMLKVGVCALRDQLSRETRNNNNNREASELDDNDVVHLLQALHRQENDDPRTRTHDVAVVAIPDAVRPAIDERLLTAITLWIDAVPVDHLPFTIEWLANALEEYVNLSPARATRAPVETVLHPTYEQLPLPTRPLPPLPWPWRPDPHVRRVRKRWTKLARRSRNSPTK